MPLLRPFRALRYGHDHFPDLSDLVWPSHGGNSSDPKAVGDVHPNNIRQLVRGDFGSLATEGAPRFTHASRLLQRWKRDGVIVRDPRPCFYPIEERWEGGRRRSLVALVRLSPFGDGEILPHEATAGRSEENLTAQLKTVEAQLSIVLSIVPDESGALASFLKQDRGEPEYWVEDGSGLRTGVWRDSDPQTHLELIEALRPEIAVIADGHHRYRAALAHQRGEGDELPVSSRETPADYVMMMLVPSTEEGLRCASSHRVCPVLGPTAREVLESSRHLFHEESLADQEALEHFLSIEDGLRFGKVLDGAISGLRLKAETPLDLPFPLSTVESAVLSHVLLDRLEEAVSQGWSEMDASGSSGSPFSHNHSNTEDILAECLRGELDLAFFLRPPTARQVFSVATAGQRLPPKSTNFTPKPTKGLLMASLRSF